jgi:FkbM family methyltransferase
MNIFRVLAATFGYQLIKKIKVYNSQNTIKSLLRIHKIDLIIDVGANIGQFAKEMRSLGYQGEILSFEPVRSSYETLLENTKNDPLWRPINLALGSASGEARINTSNLSVLNSILKFNEFALNSWETLEANNSSELIKITTLDDFVINNKLDHRRIFLKLDTQGYDLEAFKGSLRCISAVKILQSEISFIPIYQGMPSFNESLAFYVSSGFQVSSFFPVTQRPNGAVIEMDCLLVKPD